MTGGESSYEDVNAPVVGLIVLEVGVDDFDRLVVGESDLTYVVEGMGDQSEEMVSILDGLGGGFVESFSKLAPEAVVHEFCLGFAPRILLDQRGVECDAFFLLVLANIAFFVFIKIQGCTMQPRPLLLLLLYISQNYVMARFTVLERSKLHQILKTTSISPLRLTYAFVRFSLSLCFVFY